MNSPPKWQFPLQVSIFSLEGATVLFRFAPSVNKNWNKTKQNGKQTLKRQNRKEKKQIYIDYIYNFIERNII